MKKQESTIGLRIIVCLTLIYFIVIAKGFMDLTSIVKTQQRQIDDLQIIIQNINQKKKEISNPAEFSKNHIIIFYSKFKENVEEIKQSLPSPEVRQMNITAYCPCKRCNGKWAGQTASGKPPKVGTIAADTRYYPFGTKMFIPGYGWGTVEDRGGKIKGPKKIDLFHNHHNAVRKWGRKYKIVNIYQRKDLTDG